MIKYYQNKKTGDIISFNLEIKEINEFSEIQALAKENTLMEVTVKEVGGIKTKRPYNRKVKELQDFAIGKSKKEKKVNWRTLNKMKELKKAGYNSGQIAEELGLQLETVNKHYPKI